MPRYIHSKPKKLKKEMQLIYKKGNCPMQMHLFPCKMKVYKLSLNKIIIQEKKLFLQMDMGKSVKQILR